jgi:hypothetical protein
MKFYEENCYLADSSVFNIFSFPMLKGNPQTALTEPHTVVLTETIAKKYFGEEDPLNQSLLIDNENYTITGIMADVPENSHFRFDMLISFITFSSENRRAEEQAWFWNGFHTYLLVAPGENQVVKNYRAKNPLDCYAGQLNQVVMNLVSNAVDAIENRGTITIGTLEKSDMFEISVRDTGCGIPDTVRGKIFDPFFTTKPVGQGTGLGLAISYGIVRNHNGTIEVSSQEGLGSEFLVKIPLNLKGRNHGS